MRCDSHIHIIGAVERYPQLANRSGTMGVADIATVRRHGAARGISRFVIVQPSFYGTDNSMLLHGLDALGGDGRGVVVLDAGSAKPNMLADWHKRGVRGLRINLYSPIGRPGPLQQAFADMTAIARAMRWHVEVIAPLPLLLEHAALLGASPVPVVLDHYGVFGTITPDSEQGRALRGLIRQSHVWMKLSAPYRVSANPLETKPPAAWLNAFLDVGAARCVWGSDWPHTPAHDSTDGAYRAIDYAVLVDDFLAVLPPSLADAVMRDNPAKLYDFQG